MSKQFWFRNASTVLTCLGTVGLVVTTVLAVKATPKAMKLIDEVKEENGEKMSKWEMTKIVAPVYVPAAIAGVGTVTCILGANILNKKQQASIASAYTLLDRAYKNYQNKVKELYGEEAHQEIVNTITVEKAKDTYIQATNFCSSCDLAVEEHSSEPKLFYDKYSDRYFEATIEQVITAEYHLNRNYILRGYSVLNELYEFLGLETTDYGSVVGWAPLDEGMYWIDFNHRKFVMDDGRECYILEMPFEPTLEYEEY